VAAAVDPGRGDARFSPLWRCTRAWACRAGWPAPAPPSTSPRPRRPPRPKAAAHPLPRAASIRTAGRRRGPMGSASGWCGMRGGERSASRALSPAVRAAKPSR
jgi:hypothetical protein